MANVIIEELPAEEVAGAECSIPSCIVSVEEVMPEAPGAECSIPSCLVSG